ncbi:hypothetical protein BHE74_00049166 [Ensete ventricosum]|nr:hypothetical protein BHE74_00049166 [Ensete ventricosum]
MVGSMKLQPDDVPRYSLGIGLSSNDTVGSRRKFARRFVVGIGKLAGNTKGDRRKEDRRTCHKIIEGCRSIRELGFDLHPKKIGSGCRCASRRRTRKWT